jgi:TctA family transporter
VSEYQNQTYCFSYYDDCDSKKKKTPSGVMLASALLIVLPLTAVSVMVAIALLKPITYEHPRIGLLSGIAAYCYNHPVFFIMMILFVLAMMVGIGIWVTILHKNAK